MKTPLKEIIGCLILGIAIAFFLYAQRHIPSKPPEEPTVEPSSVKIRKIRIPATNIVFEDVWTSVPDKSRATMMATSTEVSMEELTIGTNLVDEVTAGNAMLAEDAIRRILGATPESARQEFLEGDARRLVLAMLGETNAHLVDEVIQPFRKGAQ